MDSKGLHTMTDKEIYELRDAIRIAKLDLDNYTLTCYLDELNFKVVKEQQRRYL